MRIAQVAPLSESVPPKGYGGTERVVSWLTEELVASGHDVTLFASGGSQTSARFVPCSRAALRLDPECQDPLPHHVLMVERVAEAAQNFDVIHFHIDYLHFQLSRAKDLCQVSTLHGRLDIPDLVPLFKEFPEMPLVSISHAQRKPLNWASWVGNVYHGLPADLFKPQYSPEKYLAFLGRMSREKRPDRAIEIAIRLGVPLKMAAKVDRADRDYFEREIKGLLNHHLIEFIGEIDESQKQDFLGNATACLMPIDWPEPFGLTMIESMACGTPVIAFRDGSVPEIITDGRNGFIVDSVEEAVEAVARISSISRRDCRYEFETRFTAARMAAEYLRIYETQVCSSASEQDLAIQ